MTTVLPHVRDLLWPVLAALKALDGSATVTEIYQRVVEDQGFSEDQQAVLTRDGKMPVIQYRLHWARTNLKGIGAVENSARGVWAITEKGAGLTQDQLRVDVKAWLADVRSKRLGRKTANADDGADAEDREDGHTPELTWKEQLLDRLLQLPPSGFERLAQRILREAGFVNVTVTGKSGDGGIDGVGTYRLSLVSFPIYFQCKRYRGAVPSRDVRDFRGALVGRGEKGLFITTGSFTRDAQREATREGASPIELIDGNQLCDLLKQYRLGVAVESRTVEDVALRPQFFDEYE